MKKGFTAFTLAEVLIVLAIIGVVAALTMPMLTANYQKTQSVSAFKKVYSQFSEAIERNMADENVENFSETSLIFEKDASNKPDPTKFLKEYFKVSTFCKREFDKCFTTAKSMDKVNSGQVADGDDGSVILKDGTALGIYIIGADQDPVANVHVDINGKNPPNVGGRDIITFNIYKDGSVDDVSPQDLFDNGTTARADIAGVCKSKFQGEGCLSKLIDAGWKMDDNYDK